MLLLPVKRDKKSFQLIEITRRKLKEWTEWKGRTPSTCCFQSQGTRNPSN